MERTLEYNIYTFLSIVAASIAIIIIIICVIKYNRTISISKDGISINTKDGAYISKEIIEKEKMEKSIIVNREKLELVEITKQIEFMKKNEILCEQMNYIERELQVYYKKNLELISDILDSETIKMYQLVYEIHKIRMLQVIKKILRENHLLEKSDWTAYKERQRLYTWETAKSIIDELFSMAKADRKSDLLITIRDKIESLYQFRFYEWMDEFKRITGEMETETKKLEDRQIKLIKGENND